ncbi:Crp/Fnr family transcriptional regulator [Paraflavitalea sp. CAU 1676]|uniref:Crp/Fnr family transcriptional regulator n=1 Tax=Paraflavitalea sp. CAU 1676 TaxID=3032598 RepID=UPI0023DCD257|nr:Crp/Fnr family transcriptional regulator [Paraflavitalea sp. CAU 1676]MDF2191257.1 Crp/Fnr family transcriptional regulator [Paraflavitalea sp. CAU 1676]
MNYKDTVFNKETLAEMFGHFKLKKVKRNNILLHEGEICKTFNFVKKGCIRNYFIDKKGNDKTRSVTLEGNVGTGLSSFIAEQPSTEFIDTLEDSELLTISRNDFFQLTTTRENWKQLYQQFLETTYLHQSRKIEALMTLNAQQRFQKLMHGNPLLIQRLSNKVLASYLDMREETLSRIKSQ